MLTSTCFTCRGVERAVILRGSDQDAWCKQRRMLHGHPEHVETCAECRDLTAIQAALVGEDDYFTVYPRPAGR